MPEDTKELRREYVSSGEIIHNFIVGTLENDTRAKPISLQKAGLNLPGIKRIYPEIPQLTPWDVQARPNTGYTPDRHSIHGIEKEFPGSEGNMSVVTKRLSPSTMIFTLGGTFDIRVAPFGVELTQRLKHNPAQRTRQIAIFIPTARIRQQQEIYPLVWEIRPDGTIFPPNGPKYGNPDPFVDRIARFKKAA